MLSDSLYSITEDLYYEVARHHFKNLLKDDCKEDLIEVLARLHLIIKKLQTLPEKQNEIPDFEYFLRLAGDHWNYFVEDIESE